MRIVGLVFSLLVTLSVAVVALTYIPGYIGQQRIYVEGHNNHYFTLPSYSSGP